MNLTLNERSSLIYSQLKDSYAFWKIKKSIKNELKKRDTINEDLSDLIPKILVQNNLDTKIKNCVQEVLDKQGYFKDNVTVAKNKFKDCVDISFLPTFYKDKDFEPLLAVASARRSWNEKLKYKLNQISWDTRKPYVQARWINPQASKEAKDAIMAVK